MPLRPILGSCMRVRHNRPRIPIKMSSKRYYQRRRSPGTIVCASLGGIQTSCDRKCGPNHERKSRLNRVYRSVQEAASRHRQRRAGPGDDRCRVSSTQVFLHQRPPPQKPCLSRSICDPSRQISRRGRPRAMSLRCRFWLRPTGGGPRKTRCKFRSPPRYEVEVAEPTSTRTAHRRRSSSPAHNAIRNAGLFQKKSIGRTPYAQTVDLRPEFLSLLQVSFPIDLAKRVRCVHWPALSAELREGPGWRSAYRYCKACRESSERARDRSQDGRYYRSSAHVAGASCGGSARSSAFRQARVLFLRSDPERQPIRWRARFLAADPSYQRYTTSYGAIAIVALLNCLSYPSIFSIYGRVYHSSLFADFRSYLSGGSYCHL